MKQTTEKQYDDVKWGLTGHDGDVLVVFHSRTGSDGRVLCRVFPYISRASKSSRPHDHITSVLRNVFFFGVVHLVPFRVGHVSHQHPYFLKAFAMF